MKSKRTHFSLPSVIVVTFAIILFFTNCTTVFATDSMDNTAGDATIVSSVITPSDGSITPRGDLGSYIRKTLVETTYKKKVFAKYLTSSWAKTSYYEVKEGSEINYSFGLAYEGVTISISGSKTIGSTFRVSADPTRYSRNAAWADVTIKKYLVKRYTTGGILVDTYYSYTPVTTATYIYPKYQ